MLKWLKIENFKSWADTGIVPLAPITGLFGANSSGKTSLLQFLLMLKQTVESTDRTRVLQLGNGRSSVDLGTFSDVIHQHQIANALAFDLRWEPSARLRQKLPLKVNHGIGFTAIIRADTAESLSPRLRVERFHYRLDQARFGMQYVQTTSGFLSDMAPRAWPKEQYLLEADGYELKSELQTFPPAELPLPAPIRFYGFPDETYAQYRNVGFLADLALELEKLFQQIFYLGPIREYFHRTYQWSGEPIENVGVRGEYTIQALLAARALRQSFPTVEERVARWLKEMKLIEDFSVRPIAEHRDEYEVKVRQNRNSAEVSISDVGFGVSQILPVLVLCAYAPPGSVLLLEQPELHLHPSVQYDLADVLIDAMQNRQLQIILESHSEHLLQRLQRRIAERDELADKLALYFCEIKQAASTLTPLRLDEYGNISNWPPDFFGDEMGELTARAEAAANRQENTAQGKTK